MSCFGGGFRRDHTTDQESHAGGYLDRRHRRRKSPWSTRLPRSAGVRRGSVGPGPTTASCGPARTTPPGHNFLVVTGPSGHVAYVSDQPTGRTHDVTALDTNVIFNNP